MSFADLLDDLILGPLNLIDRGQGLLAGLMYGDMGYQFAIPRADKDGRHTLNEVSEILARYGIPVYGRTHDAHCMYFRVKKRQARWAEYILLNAGVELRNPSVDRRNSVYVASHPPDWMPKPWAEKDRTPQSEEKAPQQEPQSSSLADWLDNALRFMDRL